MEIFSAIKIDTAQNEQGDWYLTLDAKEVKLSLDQARDLARVLREVTHAPAALHRAPFPEPTFCEEDKVL